MSLCLIKTVVLGLAVAATPETSRPIDALEALSRYGTLPECRPREEITGPGDGFDHQHRSSPPEARFAGKASEFIPYTRHADRRVVLRAATLLCFEGSAAARETLGALARRWPCERELAAMAWAHGVAVDERCGEPGSRDDRELLLLAPASTLHGWTETVDRALHGQLTALNAEAWEQAMEAMTLLDRSRTRTVVKTLAALDTAPAVRRLLVASKALFATLAQGHLRELFESAGLLALDALARKLGVTTTEALLELVRGASGPEVAALADLQLSHHRLMQGQGEAARALLQKQGTTPAGRSLLEKLVQATGKSSSAAWLARQQQLGEWERFRDRPALRAYAKDEQNLHADRRAAAKVLARLGDPSGLALWESSSGLTEEEIRARADDLSALMREAQGPVYAQAKKLLDAVWMR